MKTARLLPIVVLAIVCLMGPNAALAQQSEQKSDLSGIYKCQGSSTAGEKYQGIVEIARRDDTYLVRWIIPPQDVYIGIGIVQGDFLAVSYTGTMLGLVIYKIEPDTSLTGRWTALDAVGHVFLETLQKTEWTSEPVPAQPPATTAPHSAPDPDPPIRPASGELSL